MTPHRGIQERIEWGNQEKTSRSRRTADHHRRVARKSGQIRQKPEAEQSGEKNIGEKCSVPRRKYAAKG